MAEQPQEPTRAVPALRLGALTVPPESPYEAKTPRRTPLSETVRSLATPRISRDPDEPVSALVRSIVTPRTGSGHLTNRSSVDPMLADLMSPRKPQKKKWDGLVTSNDISHIRDCFKAVQEVCNKNLEAKQRLIDKLLAELRALQASQGLGTAVDAALDPRVHDVRAKTRKTVDAFHKVFKNQVDTETEPDEVFAAIHQNLDELENCAKLTEDEISKAAALAVNVQSAEPYVIAFNIDVNPFGADRVAELEAELERVRSELKVLEEKNKELEEQRVPMTLSAATVSVEEAGASRDLRSQSDELSQKVSEQQAEIEQLQAKLSEYESSWSTPLTSTADGASLGRQLLDAQRALEIAQRDCEEALQRASASELQTADSISMMQHQQDLDALKVSQANELDQLNTDHSAALEQLQSSHADSIRALEASSLASISQLDEMQKQLTESQTKTHELEDKLAVAMIPVPVPVKVDDDSAQMSAADVKRMETLEQLAGDNTSPLTTKDADVQQLSRQLLDAQRQLEVLHQDSLEQARLIDELNAEKERLTHIPMTVGAAMTSVEIEGSEARGKPTDDTVLGVDRTSELAAEAALLASQLSDKEKRLDTMNSELSDIIAALGLPPLSGDTDVVAELIAARKRIVELEEELARLREAPVISPIVLEFNIVAGAVDAESLQELQQQLSGKEEQLAAVQQQLAELQNNIEQKNRQIAEGEARNVILQKEFDSLQNILSRLMKKLQAAKEEMALRDKDLEPLTKQRTMVVQTQTAKDKEIAERKYRVELVEAEIRTDEELLGELEDLGEVDYDDLDALTSIVQEQSERHLIIVAEKAEHEEELREALESLDEAFEDHRGVTRELVQVAEVHTTTLLSKTEVAERAINEVYSELIAEEPAKVNDINPSPEPIASASEDELDAASVEKLVKAMRVSGIASVEFSNVGASAAALRLLGEGFRATRSVSVLKLSSVTITEDGAAELSAGLADNVSLTDVEITNVGLTQKGWIDLCAALQRNTHITSLNLSNNMASAEAANAVASLVVNNKNLRTLDLSHTGMGDTGANNLAKALVVSTSLQTLSLNSCNLGDSGCGSLCHALATNNGIVTLDLSNNHIGTSGAESLARAMKTNHALRTLRLANNLMQVQGATHLLESVGEHASLTMLDLTGNNIVLPTEPDENDSGFRAALSLAKQVEDISLWSNRLGVQGGIAVADLLDVGKLTSINLRGCDLGDAGVQAVSSAACTSTQLRRLNVAGNSINDEGFVAVAQILAGCAKLEELDCSGNQLSPSGIQSLNESLPRAVSLQTLDLTLTAISDAALASLARGLCLATSLTRVKLGFNYLGVASGKIVASIIRALPQLVLLDIKNNNLAEGVKDIMEATKSHAKLSDIDISCNGGGLEAARSIAEMLRANKCVRRLELRGNNLRDEGVRLIADSIKMNTTLEKIILDSNRISDPGAVALSESILLNKSLRTVSVRKNAFTAEGIASLKRAHKATPLVNILLMGDAK